MNVFSNLRLSARVFPSEGSGSTSVLRCLFSPKKLYRMSVPLGL
uniref:Uncharacterized protein n=1 Tax=Anguilla anguilla TaxID=7936 RepID=A0A0E9T4F6_ANGAN